MVKYVKEKVGNARNKPWSKKGKEELKRMEMNAKLDKILEQMEVGFSELRKDMAEVKSDVSMLKAEVDNLKQDMSCVKTTIENEIWPGIKVIAEGHLDLSHKLDTYITIAQEDKKYNAEVECLKLRMLELENNAKLNSRKN